MLTLRTWISGTTLISPTVSPDTCIHPHSLQCQPHLDMFPFISMRTLKVVVAAVFASVAPYLSWLQDLRYHAHHTALAEAFPDGPRNLAHQANVAAFRTTDGLNFWAAVELGWYSANRSDS